MKNNKKIIIVSVVTCISIISLCAILVLSNGSEKNVEEVVESEKLNDLPKPEITGGVRGELGIDKNINETTIDQYLNRSDSVYRDMRMLEDPASYEKIGGDRFLSGYIDGFEVIPLPYIIPVTGLPNEVGDTYTGSTLFYSDNGRYVPNYEESINIIERIFPKDKVIFLMCGGGGYAGMTKNFLVSLGWDENKIYNVGGYWYYKGKNSINVKREIDGVVSYDFDSVPYHNIEFDKLTKSSNYKEPIVKVTDLKINTSKIELEEGTSFKLNVIVLPNEATNKEVNWTSSNQSVATVTSEGLVTAIGEGNSIITANSYDGNKTITCEVNVNKRVISTRIKIDDLKKEAEEFEKYNIEKIYKEFTDTVENSDGTTKDEYSIITQDRGRQVNDLWRQEYKKWQQKDEQAKKIRLEMFNKLVDEKRSFIILIHTKDCKNRDYIVVDGAEKILKQNNYPYFNVGTPVTDGDETLEKSKLDTSNLNSGSVAIVKDGEIYVSINPNVDSIKSDEEIKNWLSKYIDIQ